ncbi:polysaccharide ABC transporter ATP-binding protein [Mucilaginibacter sabulilitoris]|uniref:Polysaccharide ABC transporter ATP-binding protein n=1 Tax=Mucilaginibacter sabulilitoris TaxID=1173583 RepID=A0ABZ0TEL6_9SPHI|nr:polysaccharide ABC transporter ATP-binding protein [Mucilaginibacter sabulilitoris]WPU91634.1 polysaccharide ABC transporter ATP-binding protein [Mucilaginibacter sabulilitoris]
MAKVIKVEHLSKAYQLGDFGTGTISRDLERYWARIRGKEDPFLKIGETNDRTTKGHSDIVWSLKDINFEIEQGDAVGIIGRNGAGKSTLLKILSRVTSPTAGAVKIKGRVASLLEVGTGFHPELSGRENIFLNGAILGMRKAEIKRKFDEIVAFSGVERYIDTPVKRYSSGMYVRLAFAVAAHLESEILIVDEVLAVGDAEFQKKCLGKIGDISKGEGRTVLFVSHNLGAVQKLCRNIILMHNGAINNMGEANHMISAYLQDVTLSKSVYEVPSPANTGDIPGYAYKIQVEDAQGTVINEIAAGTFWQIRVFFKITKRVEHFIIGLGFTAATEINLRTSWSRSATLDEGYYQAVFKEDRLLLSTGVYMINLGLSVREKTFQYAEDVAAITISGITDELLDQSIIRTSGTGLILNPMSVKIINDSKVFQ